MMALTKEKYNKEENTYYTLNASKEELSEVLGRLEAVLNHFNIVLDENTDFKSLYDQLILGDLAKLSFKEALNHKVYYLSQFKIKKVILVKLQEGNDKAIIKKANIETEVSLKDIFLTKKLAKRRKRNLQRYHLDKEQFSYFFKDRAYHKDTYLIEESPYSDTFRVYQKVLKTYYRPLTDKFSLEELKDIYYLDIDEVFKKEKLKFLAKQAK